MVADEGVDRDAATAGADGAVGPTLTLMAATWRGRQGNGVVHRAGQLPRSAATTLLIVHLSSCCGGKAAGWSATPKRCLGLSIAPTSSADGPIAERHAPKRGTWPSAAAAR